MNIECIALQVAAGMKAEIDVEVYAIAVGVEGETGAQSGICLQV